MKPKIIVDREPISSAEILSRRSFRQLMSDAKLVQKPFFKSTWFISSMIVTLSTIAVLVYVNTTEETETPAQEETITATTNTQPETTFRYAEDSPCIKPPFPGAEQPFTIVMIDPSKEAVLRYPNGTILVIPENSIVDENGKTVTGEVEIRYREFHNQPEIILSGIPMNYDSSGIHHSFSSAGMIQVYAYVNGKPVKLADDKSIHVELASGQSGTEFNLYSLDTTKGNWTYEGKDLVKAIPAQPGQQKDPSPVYDKNIPTKFDTTITRLKNEVVVLNNQVTAIKKTEPESPKKADPNKYNFDIDADPNEFPELARFGPVRFEVGAENKNFTSENYTITWDDVQLTENIKGKNYKITLTKGTMKREYLVYPVYEGAGYDQAMQIFEGKYGQYKDLLQIKNEEKRKKETELSTFNKKRDEEIRRKNEEMDMQRMKEIQKQTTQNQPDNSIDVSYRYRDYGMFSQNGVVYNLTPTALSSNSSIVTRVFNVKGFGTFNCDNPKVYPAQQRATVALTDHENGAIIKPSLVYLVVPSENVYFTYAYNQLANFGFNPKSENYLVAVMSDGRAGIVSRNQFKETGKKESMINFSVIITEKPLTTETAFNKLLSDV